MQTIVKTLPLSDGILTETSGGRRKTAAQFDGKIEIYEDETYVPVLGRWTHDAKKIYASVIIGEQVNYNYAVDFSSAKIYGVTGTVANERMVFDGLRFEDSDPIAGTFTMEITDLELIRKLLKIEE